MSGSEAGKAAIPTQVVKLSAVREAYAAARDLLAHVSDGSDVVLAIQLRRIVRTLKAETQQLQEDYNELVEKGAERDEDGNMKPGTNPGTVMMVDSKAFNESVKALLDQEITVSLKPIKAEALKSFKFEGFGLCVDALAEAGLLDVGEVE